MTNWNERAEGLRKEREAEIERMQADADAKRKAKDLERDAIWTKLTDVTGWAMQRYWTARIPPNSCVRFLGRRNQTLPSQAAYRVAQNSDRCSLSAMHPRKDNRGKQRLRL